MQCTHEQQHKLTHTRVSQTLFRFCVGKKSKTIQKKTTKKSQIKSEFDFCTMQKSLMKMTKTLLLFLFKLFFSFRESIDKNVFLIGNASEYNKLLQLFIVVRIHLNSKHTYTHIYDDSVDAKCCQHAKNMNVFDGSDICVELLFFIVVFFFFFFQQWLPISFTLMF